MSSKLSRSFHGPTKTYFVSTPLNYLNVASTDWDIRVTAYADGIMQAILHVAKSKLTDAERAALLDIASRACAEVSAAPPQHIHHVGPVYLPSKTASKNTCLFSYEPEADMIEVPIEDIGLFAPAPMNVEERLFKLYAKIEGVLHYREAWIEDDFTVSRHDGICGATGDVSRLGHGAIDQARKTFAALRRDARAAGFSPISPSKHAMLIVEFAVNGMGSPENLERRHELEEFLDQQLGWLGLGHIDGGSIGSGTMEAACVVVDYKIAEAALKKALAESEFSDFSRIYKQ